MKREVSGEDGIRPHAASEDGDLHNQTGVKLMTQMQNMLKIQVKAPESRIKSDTFWRKPHTDLEVEKEENKIRKPKR